MENRRAKGGPRFFMGLSGTILSAIFLEISTLPKTLQNIFLERLTYSQSQRGA